MGNCLFDAMAQALQQLVKLELSREYNNTNIASVDNTQIELLKIKIGSERMSHLIEDMQQTPLSELDAVKKLSEALISVINSEMPNLDEDFKVFLQTADSIHVLNTIVDDMRKSLQENSSTILGILKKDQAIPKDAEYKMLKQQITQAPNLCEAEKVLGNLKRYSSKLVPPSNTSDSNPRP